MCIRDSSQPFFVAIVLEQLTRHEVASVRTLVVVAHRAAREVRVVTQPAPSRFENAAKFLQIGTHGVAVEVNHGVEAIQQAHAVIGNPSERQPIAPNIGKPGVTREPIATEVDVLLVDINDVDLLRVLTQLFAVPSMPCGETVCLLYTSRCV